jgi:hypothetical protein
MQGTEALVSFADEWLEKAAQLRNFALVSKQNADHRRCVAQAALGALQGAAGGGALPPITPDQ